MKKLIPIIVGMLLLCIWSGMFIAVYGELPPINGQWKSYAFVMIETPLMIILFIIMVGATLGLWKMLNKEYTNGQ